MAYTNRCRSQINRIVRRQQFASKSETVTEEYRRMFRKLVTICFVAVLAASAAALADNRIHFRGGSVVAPGYTLKEDINTDTSTATGTLVSRDAKLNIQYSIFTNEFVFASTKERKLNHEKIIWSNRTGRDEETCIKTLVEGIDGIRTLYISFPKGGPANFVIDVSLDRKVAEKQIAEAEKIVATFRSSR